MKAALLVLVIFTSELGGTLATLRALALLHCKAIHILPTMTHAARHRGAEASLGMLEQAPRMPDVQVLHTWQSCCKQRQVIWHCNSARTFLHGKPAVLPNAAHCAIHGSRCAPPDRICAR